jgi:large subunit ribosomal protein L30
MAVKRIHKKHEKHENKEYPLIKIKLKKSTIGRNKKQRTIIKCLGLRKIDSEVIKEKRPEILGMINKVDFMLQVTDVKAQSA